MSGELNIRMEKRFPGITIEASFCQAIAGLSSTALFGPSGCGKTTILRCLAGLERPEAGRIQWGEEVWFDAQERQFLPPQQRQVGFLFQDYALFPFLTVAGNIGYGLPKAARRLVSDLLDLFQLTGFENRSPRDLSGGEQQRVALARTIIRKPRLLLLDEPLSALDLPTRTQLRRDLRHLLAKFGIPVILVTHDPMEVMALADRVVVLGRGQILQQGKVEDVFSRPADAGVARIVGVETVVTGHVEGVQHGLASVRVGTALVYAATDGNDHGEVGVCIRAEDVIVQPGEAGLSSVRNQLRGGIVSLTPEGPLVRLVIDCGFALTALITRQSSVELQLREGLPVTALVKATAIRLVSRGDTTSEYRMSNQEYRILK